MSRLHIAIEQQQVVIGFHVTQFGHPFGRLPILYLAVVQAGGYQQVGIRFRFHMVVRGVAEHIAVIDLLIGISPFVVFTGGKRNVLVQHGGHHIHKWNGGNDPVV